MKSIIISQPTDITTLGTVTTRTTVKNEILTHEKVVNFDYDTLIFTEQGFITISEGATDSFFAKGNQTTIFGDPFQQLFDHSINFEGEWNAEKIYPIWFGAKGYATMNEAKAGIDSSDAINKALCLKKMGEVYISRGIYKINKPLDMPYGVQLTGESGKKDEEGEFRTVLACDIIKPTNSNEDLTKYEYAMTINANPSTMTWKVPYPTVGSWIKSIIFENIETTNTPQQLQKCILLGGGVIFEKVTWQNFSQAIKVCSNNYIDLKKITDCVFNCYKQQDPTVEKLYAFDLGSLGDSFLFEHNQINMGTSTKGLRIASCGGGSVNSNVINADVLIENSKGITFYSNHLERGTILEIKCSNVTLSGNYFWKGQGPSIIIYGNEYSDESIVTSINDLFIYYDALFFIKTNDYDSFIPSSNSDIELDKNSILHLTNSLRYWNNHIFGKSYTTGIILQKKEQTNNSTTLFEEFNKHSYAYSRRCDIGTQFKINAQFSIQSPDTNSNFILQVNSGVAWVCKNLGYYTYDVQIYWDRTRGLIYSKDGEYIFKLNNYKTQQRTIDFSETASIDGHLYHPGAIIRVTNSEFISGSYLRLIRKRYSDSNCSSLIESHTVDVPLCGTEYLYDNGESINGFKWNKITDPILFPTNPIHGAHFIGQNIICHTTQNTTTGNGWKKGDLLLNIGNDTSWEIKIVK